MSEASELIAQQILNATINKKNWGQVLYNVKVFGAKGDGIYNDTQAVQDAIDTALFNGASLVYFPPGSYKVTSLINTSTINFVGDNAEFVGYEGTITQLAARAIALNVKDFGAVGDGIHDDTVALQAARDHLASLSHPGELVFPAGIYKYSVSPNWAIQDAMITASGEVRLRYTGTGNAVILQGGPIGNYNVTFGRFIVECPTTAQNAVYVALLHHSKISVSVRGAGAAYAGLRVEGCVCTLFDNLVVSNNEEGWYLSAKPAIGAMIEKWDNVSFPDVPTSYCTFINPVLENTNYGCYAPNSYGCSYIGGTMEGCTNVGLQIGPLSTNNKFFGIDFEANTDSDINCSGQYNSFYDCDGMGTTIFDVGSIHNVLIGGRYNQITIASAAKCTALKDLAFKLYPSGGITDLSVTTRKTDLFDIQTQDWMP